MSSVRFVRGNSDYSQQAMNAAVGKVIGLLKAEKVFQSHLIGCLFNAASAFIL